MSKMLASAIAYASMMHENQLDKGGKPYILHPLRLMFRMSQYSTDPELLCMCVLHDVVEDCGVTREDLLSIGMSDRVIYGVMTLSRLKDETYDQFIDRICMSRDTMLVKLEDLRDNSDPSRLIGVTTRDLQRIEKYMKAYKKIETSLKLYDQFFVEEN